MTKKLPKTKIAAAAANVLILAMLVSLGAFAFTAPSDQNAVSASDDPVFITETEGKIALMFNVYQGSEYLPEILRVLDVYGAKCTFFVGGCWADDNNELVKAIADAGHEIGNHGYFHKDHKGMTETQNLAEITPLNSLVEAITGTAPTLFAPPSGSWDDTTVKTCKDLGMRVIMWSRDTIDWRDQDAATIFARATRSLSQGELILAHPTAKTTEALPRILTKVSELGLSAVTVSELLAG